MARETGSVAAEPTATEEYYRMLLSERRRGTLKELACARGVSYSALTWWKHEIGRRDRLRAVALGGERGHGEDGNGSRPRFLPVRLSPPSAVPALFDGAAASGRFEVRLLSGHAVAVPMAFDADGLRKLVAVLEETAC